MRPAPRWLQRGLAIGLLLLVAWQGWYLGWVLKKYFQRVPANFEMRGKEEATIP